MTLTFVKKESLGKNSSFKNVEKIFVKQRTDDTKECRIHLCIMQDYHIK